jgi:hypothetical protein
MSSLRMSPGPLADLIESFTTRLVAAVQTATAARVRVILREQPPLARPAPARAKGSPPKRAGRKPLCPLPGCKSPAAFGMACAEHKDVPTAVLAKYDAERRGDFSHLGDAATDGHSS